MPAFDQPAAIPPPKDRPKHVGSAAIHAISLARSSLTVARGHAAHGWIAKVRPCESRTSSPCDDGPDLRGPLELLGPVRLRIVLALLRVRRCRRRSRLPARDGDGDLP